MKTIRLVMLSVLALSACQNRPGSIETDEQAAPLVVDDCPCRDRDRPAGAPSGEQVDVSTLDLSRAPAKGNADAEVTLIAFCDFECPFCKRVQPTLAELEQSYGPELEIVFKQLPLPFHEHARGAAIAAFAAHEQGRFWQFHDALFLDKDRPDRDKLERAAVSAGLELGRFRRDLESPELAERVERDVSEATRLGIRGTPTFVINGKKLGGAQPIEQFKKLIDEALAAEK